MIIYCYSMGHVAARKRSFIINHCRGRQRSTLFKQANMGPASIGARIPAPHSEGLQRRKDRPGVTGVQFSKRAERLGLFKMLLVQLAIEGVMPRMLSSNFNIAEKFSRSSLKSFKQGLP